LGEIETQLVRHAPVKEAVVLAREDVPGEKRLVAYLVPRNPGETESSLRAETLRAALKTCLPEYMVPSAFVILERFPLTGNGKLDRRALPAPELGAYATSQYEVPEGKVEEALADIWQRLLRVERVGRKDNFFALGGHSLQGMQLIAQIEQKLVVGLPPTAVFQYPTVQQMASAVSSLLATNATTSITPDGSSLRLERAPATFSQLAHWHMYRLSERRAIRQIASAIRLHGQLNVEALRQSLAAVVRRHDALRVRIVVTDGVPTQEISQIDGSELKCSNLTALSEQAREAEVSRMIEELILEPINPMVAPLFGVWLAKLRETEHVLVVAMEHMISDAVSMSILLRDLFSAYAHILRGHAPSLPAIPLQFPEYAVLQRNTHAAWMERHGAYWARRRAECSRTRFPVDKDAPEGDGIGWGTTPLRIGTRLKGQLQEWCRLRHTTLALSVLTAYIATVLRWCDVSEAVVVYQTDGRFDPKVQHTIGYFASALYLRVRLLESDSFVDFLTRVTSEYVAASEHADSFYMESQVPPPEFTRSSCFNWVSPGAEMDSSELTGLPEALTYSPITFEHPMLKGLHRETDPFVLLQASADQVFGGLHFPRNRFSVGTMEKFSRQFLGLIEQMLRDPQRRVREIASLD
jgi:acyl carrier protein